MTYDEAKELAAISVTIDGGCSHCVKAFVQLLNDKFSEFEWKTVDLEKHPYIAVAVRPWYEG